MQRKTVSVTVLMLLLTGISALTFYVQPVKSQPKTWTVDDDGPADFHTIQEAIDIAGEGDTIFVYNGTYFEQVVVNKTVALVGQDRNSTTIDGGGSGTVVFITSSNVSIMNFTVQNSGLFHPQMDSGVRLESNDNMITHNTLKSNCYGVYVGGSHNLVSYNTVTNNNFGIWIVDDNNTLSANFISNCQLGIWAYGQSHHIERNVIANIEAEGMHVSYSSYNFIVGNDISNTRWGMIIDNSEGNFLRDNNMMGNEYNFGLWAPIGIHDIDVSNLVNEKPIYYLVDKHDKKVPNNAGCVILVGSTNILMENLSLTHNQDGVQIIGNCDNVTIRNIDASKNQCGIRIYSCTRGNVSIFRSNLTNNSIYGIFIQLVSASCINISESNLINNTHIGLCIDRYYQCTINAYHSNFINNAIQVKIYESTDSHMNWNNAYPLGGNYWSDYTGNDTYMGAYQNKTGSDGIGDTQYVIDADNQDNYPLMNPWTPIETRMIVKGKDYPVVIVSNTTINRIVATKNTLHFKCSGPTGETGYILVIFPMVNTTEIKVFIDGKKLTPPPFPVINTNGTHYFIYFEFKLSAHDITLQFAPLAPPVPVGGVWVPINKLELLAPWIGLASLFMVATASVVYVRHRKKKQD